MSLHRHLRRRHERPDLFLIIVGVAIFAAAIMLAQTETDHAPTAVSAHVLRADFPAVGE